MSSISKINRELNLLQETMTTACVGVVPDVSRMRLSTNPPEVVPVKRGDGLYDLVLRSFAVSDRLLAVGVTLPAALEMGQSLADLYGGVLNIPQ